MDDPKCVVGHGGRLKDFSGRPIHSLHNLGDLLLPTAVVIDDSRIMRNHLKALLTEAGCEVVGEGGSGDDVIPLYEQFRPDLMTVDVVMPGTDGVTAATNLLKQHGEANVVMCTSTTSREKILACQRAGVSHFILKPFKREKVIGVVRLVLFRASQRAREQVQ